MPSAARRLTLMPNDIQTNLSLRHGAMPARAMFSPAGGRHSITASTGTSRSQRRACAFFGYPSRAAGKTTRTHSSADMPRTGAMRPDGCRIRSY